MSRVIVIFVASILCACANSGGRTADKLDAETGVTVTYARTPMVFYRDDSGKAAHARNLVHMGPLEVNRMGGFRYYLWLGVWNTMQNADSGNVRDGFETIVIYADGEPLSFEITGWTPGAVGASEAIYVKPVSSAADAYYEVTVDHLRLIAEAQDLRLQTTGAAQANFELWDQQYSARASLREFLGQSVY